jgi:hypothetical protein
MEKAPVRSATESPVPTRLSFFMTGRDITVRNLTFDHAADQDHNSAGILAHGENRTVERSSFIVNENDLPTLTVLQAIAARRRPSVGQQVARPCSTVGGSGPQGDRVNGQQSKEGSARRSSRR